MLIYECKTADLIEADLNVPKVWNKYLRNCTIHGLFTIYYCKYFCKMYERRLDQYGTRHLHRMKEKEHLD